MSYTVLYVNMQRQRPGGSISRCCQTELSSTDLLWELKTLEVGPPHVCLITSHCVGKIGVLVDFYWLRLRGVEWVHGLFWFPLVLGKM